MADDLERTALGLPTKRMIEFPPNLFAAIPLAQTMRDAVNLMKPRYRVAGV